MELRVQWSVPMYQWLAVDQDDFREWVQRRLREMLGEGILAKLGEGWLACSAPTISEFDSVRGYSEESWLASVPYLDTPKDSHDLWPPRRVFLMAVNMEKGEPITTFPTGEVMTILPPDATKPPPALYDEFSPMPWATDVWEEMNR